MDEYIKREVVVAFLENMAASRYLIQCFENKEKFPAADVVEVVHGEWIAHGYKWRCSVCNCKLNLDGTPMENGFCYCPNCGADMRGEQK